MADSSQDILADVSVEEDDTLMASTSPKKRSPPVLKRSPASDLLFDPYVDVAFEKLLAVIKRKYYQKQIYFDLSTTRRSKSQENVFRRFEHHIADMRAAAARAREVFKQHLKEAEDEIDMDYDDDDDDGMENEEKQE